MWTADDIVIRLAVIFVLGFILCAANMIQDKETK